MQPIQLTQSLKSAVARQRFELVGIAPAVSPPGFSKFAEWLERGSFGEMEYLPNRREAYRHPDSVLEGVVSIVMLGLNYAPPTSPPTHSPSQGRVARYAWSSQDYHDLIHRRLTAVCGELRELDPDLGIRGVVDTAPLLERDFARLAGLGWQAKNTMLINRGLGSWFFLAALLLDRRLEYDQPQETSHCGTCTACLDACPTDAFPAPHVLDATRCISYLTIEHRSAIPIELRPGMGDWIFGCDVCQEVCPWNRKSPVTRDPEMQPDPTRVSLDLIALFELDDDAFRAQFRRTPMWRPRRRGLLRNAAIALGNRPFAEAIPALIRGLNDGEPLVRGASAWALGRQAGKQPRQALQARAQLETDPDVQTEIRLSLEFLESASHPEAPSVAPSDSPPGNEP